jgi:hypothetical protein
MRLLVRLAVACEPLTTTSAVTGGARRHVADLVQRKPFGALLNPLGDAHRQLSRGHEDRSVGGVLQAGALTRHLRQLNGAEREDAQGRKRHPQPQAEAAALGLSEAAQ